MKNELAIKSMSKIAIAKKYGVSRQTVYRLAVATGEDHS